jgi:hypothetical protein
LHHFRENVWKKQFEEVPRKPFFKKKTTELPRDVQCCFQTAKEGMLGMQLLHSHAFGLHYLGFRCFPGLFFDCVGLTGTHFFSPSLSHLSGGGMLKPEGLFEYFWFPT